MKLPAISKLTREQKDVYLYAPHDKHVLVSGPPGTGKTLIACLRAKEMKQRGVPVILAMFNKVLKRYTSNVGRDDEMAATTLYQWFMRWWDDSGLPVHPQSPRIAIELPYEECELAKRAGAKWDPNAFKPWAKGRARRVGAWVITPEQSSSNPEAFRRWRQWHSPPAPQSNPRAIDWAAVAAHVIVHEDTINDSALDLGTILVDEGQDFPRDFYQFMRNLCAIAAMRGTRLKSPPRLFVLADENQQLTEQNSTLKDIGDTLRVAAEHRFELKDNFRNTREVARLAEAFYADVVTGLPRMPNTTGEVPVYYAAGSQPEAYEYIETWIRNHPGKEVGIFTFRDQRRQKVFADLQARLTRIPRQDLKIQTYSSATPEHANANELRFDVPETITVLNVQSCKGLEFDAVFILEMDDGFYGATPEDRVKMQMFVATSRAREWTCILDVHPPKPGARHLRLLPKDDRLHRLHVSTNGVWIALRAEEEAAVSRRTCSSSL